MLAIRSRIVVVFICPLCWLNCNTIYDRNLETAALRTILALQHAEQQYRSHYGRYAASLQELRPPDMPAGEKRGYKFTISGTPAGYAISAVPTVFGSTGTRTFYSDQSLVICENYGPAPATAENNVVGAALPKTAQPK